MFATANSQTGEERITSFFLIANSQHSSEHCYKTSRAPFATVKKKKTNHFRKGLRAKHERNVTEKDACRRAKRERKKRGRKNRDANLPLRRRGQLCANAIPFSQVIRKTGHPPRSPYKKENIPFLSLLFSLTNQPTNQATNPPGFSLCAARTLAQRDPIEPIIT